MLIEYLKIVEEFLVKRSIHVERKIIEQKAQELGLVFPESMIEFYEFFGNNHEVLEAFHKFAPVNEISIQYDGVVFAQWPTGQGVFGILINNMPPVKMNLMGQNQISAYYYEKNKWFAESISCNRYFLNISCWQILNTLSYIGTVQIKEAALDSSLGGLMIISQEKPLYKSYSIYSYYNKEKTLLACYFPSGHLLYIASMEESNLKKFEDETGLSLNSVDDEPKTKKSNVKHNKDKNISGYFEIVERLLQKKVKHVDRNKILQRAKALGIIFPTSMIEFYEFFGNNSEVLQGYHEFYKLDEINIQNDILVFGEWHQGQSLLGIPLGQLSNKNPQIFQYISDKPYFESETCSSFFLNMACWQALNTFNDVANVELAEEGLNSTLNSWLSPISKEDGIDIGSYRVYSFYNEKNYIIACYVTDTQELHVASSKLLCLKKFEEQTGFKLNWA